MKIDIRKGIGSAYIVLRAENAVEMALLEDVQEHRDWEVDSKQAELIAGRLRLQELTLTSKPSMHV